MGQNRSNAVMATRVEANDSLDDFPTPCWATRALMEHVLRGHVHLGQICWEPACNRGFMVRALKEYFPIVLATDVHAYGQETEPRDYLWPGGPYVMPDFVITNPPFRLCEQFIEKARRDANIGCAMLVRTVFLESIGRYERLFRDTPPTYVAIFSERVPMVKGRIDEKASTATSYCWLVWIKGTDEPRPIMWIPPCRTQLERPGDYSL